MKQGGRILYPILFCVYIDELLLSINQSNLGCHIGHLSYAGLGYADDVTTSAPNLDGMQAIIHICEEFGKEYNVIWNWKKSVCIRIGNGGTPPNRRIYLNGAQMETVEHLGNRLRHDLSDQDDIM